MVNFILRKIVNILILNLSTKEAKSLVRQIIYSAPGTNQPSVHELDQFFST